MNGPTPSEPLKKFWATRRDKPGCFVDAISDESHFGGNLDVVTLSDGRVIVIGDANTKLGDGSVAIYASEEAWLGGEKPLFDDGKGL